MWYSYSTTDKLFMLVQVSSSFSPVLEHEVFAHKGTNNTIFTTLPKPAEMWQCIQLLICGSSAFFGLLAAKTFPKLSNIRTLSLITHSHKYVWNGVSIPSRWEKSAYQQLRWLYLLEVWRNCHCKSSCNIRCRSVTLHRSMNVTKGVLDLHYCTCWFSLVRKKEREFIHSFQCRKFLLFIIYVSEILWRQCFTQQGRKLGL